MEIANLTNQLKAGALWREDGGIELGGVELEINADEGELLGTTGPDDATAFVAGKNVRQEMLNGRTSFYAAKAGRYKTEGNVISVEAMQVVEGDVGAATGNIKAFDDLFVKGSVGQQYSVQGGGNVVIGGRVEEGAQVSAKGSLVIGGRVLGRQTKLIALGDIFVQSAREATIQCRKDLWFGDGLSYANVRVGGNLRTANAGKGLVQGGEAWALKQIEILAAGSPGGVFTEFTSGIDPVNARRLDEFSAKLEECGQQIVQQLRRFNMEKLDVAAIQARLAAASGPQRRVLVQAARLLGLEVQKRQALMRERETVLQAMMASMNAESGVRIREQVFPGVKINLGDQNHTVEEPCDSLTVRFSRGHMEVAASP